MFFRVRVVKTVLSANGHFAGATPAIFVIFVDFRGPRSKIPCFCGQNAISEVSPIFVKTTCFRQGTKRPFSKTTVSTTLIFCGVFQGFWMGFWSPCRKRSPAKGVWQKSDEKSDRSIRKSDRKVTESVPKTK